MNSVPKRGWWFASCIQVLILFFFFSLYVLSLSAGSFDYLLFSTFSIFISVVDSHGSACCCCFFPLFTKRKNLLSSDDRYDTNLLFYTILYYYYTILSIYLSTLFSFFKRFDLVR